MDKEIEELVGSVVTTDLMDFHHSNFKLRITTSLGYVVIIFVGADDNDGYSIYRYDPFESPWSHHWDSGVLFYEVSKDGIKNDVLLAKLAPYNNKKSFWLDSMDALSHKTSDIGLDDILGHIKEVDVTYYYKYAFSMTICTTKGVEVRVGTEGIYEKIYDYDVLSFCWFEHMTHGIEIYDVIVDGKSDAELLKSARAELKSARSDAF